MARDIPATIVAALAGVAGSMAGGFMVASYVTSGVTAGYEPRATARVRPVPPVFVDDLWPPRSYDRVVLPVARVAQPGVRASGSSRL